MAGEFPGHFYCVPHAVFVRASEWNSQTFSRIREFLFIIFVNAMFTTFVEPRFTKAFE
ncbi:hypothetical protein AB8B21_19900 [Tardiphaga sp. 866_E4_N2_1]|jgi:hypothetical protein|uniref:hypothetical protein n=1 Tax=unclassified Tardiphaga TaxID=2631404 RepID=UPI0008A7E4E5|nr:MULTISPECIES: hypothetical protein [unclassified Tardiphaga]WPO43106.1 hypothetical protein SFY93_08145 [Tardiphaga sp. 42S5]SEI16554.1 hypothetical protein SAMN05216367_4401 [Tardiphaga sp. OK245]